MVVFAVTDRRNRVAPQGGLAPVFIGLTVSCLISFIAPLTQACFNPARDFGPRLFGWLAGWGAIAMPGPRGFGFLTVYIVAPIVGAMIGSWFYDAAIRSSVVPLAKKVEESLRDAGRSGSVELPGTTKALPH
jgi:glycerol uptake facilitator protein